VPWYDFQCEACGNEFECELALGSTTRPKCPACKSARTVKVFSAAGIQFKGSGFYVTDSRPTGGGKAGGKEIKPAAETPAESAPSTPAEAPPAPAKGSDKIKPAKSK
jgi:putative FmdB family regulatory protein